MGVLALALIALFAVSVVGIVFWAVLFDYRERGIIFPRVLPGMPFEKRIEQRANVIELSSVQRKDMAGRQVSDGGRLLNRGPATREVSKNEKRDSRPGPETLSPLERLLEAAQDHVHHKTA